MHSLELGITSCPMSHCSILCSRLEKLHIPIQSKNVKAIQKKCEAVVSRNPLLGLGVSDFPQTIAPYQKTKGVLFCSENKDLSLKDWEHTDMSWTCCKDELSEPERPKVEERRPSPRGNRLEVPGINIIFLPALEVECWLNHDMLEHGWNMEHAMISQGDAGPQTLTPVNGFTLYSKPQASKPH